jgi:FdhD protein
MMRDDSLPIVLPAGLSPVNVTHWQGNGVALSDITWAHSNSHDVVAQEEPVALVFNGVSHAVMMATPDHLEDFALGFALTEGLIGNKQELYEVEVETSSQGTSLLLKVSAACEWRLKEKRRTLAGRTGCGLCGTDQLSMVKQKLSTVSAVSINRTILLAAQTQLKAHQQLQSHCGATHAAAWFDLDGQFQIIREDVGRHNALDKLVGALVSAATDPRSGFIFITSRASFEMVQKTVAFGSGLLAAVSAPTALAIEVADASNLCLAGFVREQSLNVYTYQDRIFS